MITQTASRPWPKYPSIYEINTRIWLAEFSVAAGRALTLDQIPSQEIERIAEHGFHAVWLMGVWTTGSRSVDIARTHPGLQEEYRAALPDFTVEDIIGSPYAISDYSVSPKLGGPEALAGLRAKFARHGISLILDFVCNHTACGHPLADKNPEVYILGSDSDFEREPQSYFKNANGRVLAHGRDPYFPAWTDTAQINYAQAPGRNAMRSELLSIAGQCDGVRCDMAMLILPEIIEQVWGKCLGSSPILSSFWPDAIRAVRTRHANFMFLGESYWNLDWELQKCGFNFTYDKTLYDRLLQNEFNSVRQHLYAERAFQDCCARFIENHDEPRAATSFGMARTRSAASVTFFSGGLRLFHEGQLEGWRIKVPVQLGRRQREPENVETAVFHDKLLAFLNDPVFHNGVVSQREVRTANGGDSSNGSLIALWWTSSEKRSIPASASSTSLSTGPRQIGCLIVVNLNGATAYGRIPLPADIFTGERLFLFNDRGDGKRYEREAAELREPGLYVALEPHQTHWFEVSEK